MYILSHCMASKKYKFLYMSNRSGGLIMAAIEFEDEIEIEWAIVREKLIYTLPVSLQRNHFTAITF